MDNLHAVLIIVKNREQEAPKVNQVLNKYADLVLGRMGLPHQECSNHAHIITLVIKASQDQLKQMGSEIKQIPGVEIRCTAEGCKK